MPMMKVLNDAVRVWKYALGSFSDEKTKEVDNAVVLVRSFIFLTYLITNCFIISGVIRHWNANEKENISCDRTSRVRQSLLEQDILTPSRSMWLEGTDPTILDRTR